MTIQTFDTDALAPGSVTYNRDTKRVEIVTEITSFEEIGALEKVLRRALQARGQHTANERWLKGTNPATYGLKHGQLVRIGKGQIVWTLVSISVDVLSHEFKAKLVQSNGPFPDKFTSANVTRLVSAEPVTERLYASAEAAAAAS